MTAVALPAWWKLNADVLNASVTREMALLGRDAVAAALAEAGFVGGSHLGSVREQRVSAERNEEALAFRTVYHDLETGAPWVVRLSMLADSSGHCSGLSRCTVEASRVEEDHAFLPGDAVLARVTLFSFPRAIATGDAAFDIANTLRLAGFVMRSRLNPKSEDFCLVAKASAFAHRLTQAMAA